MSVVKMCGLLVFCVFYLFVVADTEMYSIAFILLQCHAHGVLFLFFVVVAAVVLNVKKM